MNRWLRRATSLDNPTPQAAGGLPRSSSADNLSAQAAHATNSSEQKEVGEMRVLIPGKLAYVSAANSELSLLRKKLMQENRAASFVSSELHQRYVPFAADFGPVNLGVVNQFCSVLEERMSRAEGLVIYCIDTSHASRANASFLLGAYLMINYEFTPEEASEPFSCSTAPFTLRPFRDASYLHNSYPLSILDCLSGLAKAIKLGWYSPSTFNCESYDALDSPTSGDMHELCPKFIAMKGPLDYGSRYRHPEEIALSASECIDTLRELGVTCVIRLNESDTYNPEDFTRHGIRHVDLFFQDCSTPPDAIVECFLDIADREPRIAVHCRAGLGRTGTLIALWMMRHHAFTASEAIGWIRVVRPGSVIGPQQQYLAAAQRRRWRGNCLVPLTPSPPASPPSTFAAGAKPCDPVTSPAGLRLPAVGAAPPSPPLANSQDLAAHFTQCMCARGAQRAAEAAAAPDTPAARAVQVAPPAAAPVQPDSLRTASSGSSFRRGWPRSLLPLGSSAAGGGTLGGRSCDSFTSSGDGSVGSASSSSYEAPAAERRVVPTPPPAGRAARAFAAGRALFSSSQAPQTKVW